MPGRRYAFWASVREGSGAAESVWAVALRAKASSASDRVPGVRPEGVAMAKSPSEGGRRLDWSVMVVDLRRVRRAHFCLEQFNGRTVFGVALYCGGRLKARIKFSVVRCIYSAL